MKMLDTGEKGNLSIKAKEEVIEEVDTFRYLGGSGFRFKWENGCRIES